MDGDTVPHPKRPKLNPYTKALRRERIFSRLRLGWPYEKIALWEGISQQRVRKIVSDALARQTMDDGPDHALLQLFRLEAAHELAAEAVAAGDLKAIGPYLKLLDAIDHYQKAGSRKVVYNAAAREKLFAKMNRVVTRIEAQARKSAKRPAVEPRPDPETKLDSGVSL
ncbi:MAG TPA: hypothetical protein VF886_10325 [Roseiarcus sp.]|jgi:hypothetical protein